MSRTKGARNILPSEEQQKHLLKLLRDKAAKGDSVAAGLLLLVATVREREGRHG